APRDGRPPGPRAGDRAGQPARQVVLAAPDQGSPARPRLIRRPTRARFQRRYVLRRYVRVVGVGSPGGDRCHNRRDGRTAPSSTGSGGMFDAERYGVRRWAWLAALVVGASLIALFYALPAGEVPQSAVYDALGVTMVAAALLGVRIHRPAGWLPWVILAIGQLLFVFGDVIWTMYAAIGEDPFPSPADASYLAGYPVLAIGLALAIRRRVSGGDRAGVLDGAILATGAVVVWCAFVLGPLVAVSDPDPLGFAISIAYPVGD